MQCVMLHLLLVSLLKQHRPCSSSATAGGRMLLQPIDAASLIPLWQDHGSGSPLPGAAFAVPTAELGVDTWQQGNHSWVNIFGSYWQSNYLAAGTFETIGWETSGPTAYDHFTAKVIGFRSNESFHYGPPIAAATLTPPGAELDEVAPTDPLVVIPTDFSLVGQVNKTKASLYIWRPLAPDGYVALGDLVSNSSTVPTHADFPSVRVVRADCTAPCGPAFAMWALTVKGQPPLSIWGARSNAAGDSISGAQFVATNISVSTEDATSTIPPTLQCLAAACVTPVGSSPEQVHLSLGVSTDPEKASVVIKWTTAMATVDSTCLYRDADDTSGSSSRAVGVAEVHAPAWDRTEYLHSVEIHGLSAWSAYTYQCGSLSAGVMTPPVRFHIDTPVPTIAWLGDTGNHPMWTQRTVPAIGKLVDQGEVDAFVHVPTLYKIGVEFFCVSLSLSDTLMMMIIIMIFITIYDSNMYVLSGAGRRHGVLFSCRWRGGWRSVHA